jgi:glycosyltransferase involved in cell wall biosynthesis
LKLCFISHPDSPHTRRWLNWFIRRGHEVCLLADVPQRQPWPEAQVINLPSIINARVIKYVIWEIYIRQFLDRWRPDILHAHRVSSAGWLGAFSGFHPFVVTPWGSDLYQHPQRSRLARWLAFYTLRHADLVTANSQALSKQAILFGALPERTHLIRWGVDFERVHPLRNRDSQKKILGISDNPVILSPRALRPIYNIDILIEAMPRVLSVIPHVILVLRDITPT